MASDLLEIGELADFHTIAPDFPPKTPRAEGRAFPVIFDKTDIVKVHVDTNGLKRAQIQLLQVRWAGFDQHLILVIMLQAVRVLSVAPGCWAARRLHISRSPGF